MQPVPDTLTEDAAGQATVSMGPGQGPSLRRTCLRGGGLWDELAHLMKSRPGGHAWAHLEAGTGGRQGLEGGSGWGSGLGLLWRPGGGLGLRGVDRAGPPCLSREREPTS